MGVPGEWPGGPFRLRFAPVPGKLPPGTPRQAPNPYAVPAVCVAGYGPLAAYWAGPADSFIR